MHTFTTLFFLTKCFINNWLNEYFAGSIFRIWSRTVLKSLCDLRCWACNVNKKKIGRESERGRVRGRECTKELLAISLKFMANPRWDRCCHCHDNPKMFVPFNSKCKRQMPTAIWWNNRYIQQMFIGLPHGKWKRERERERDKKKRNRYEMMLTILFHFVQIFTIFWHCRLCVRAWCE